MSFVESKLLIFVCRVSLESENF